MRDIHCHILPGVDDGAEDLAESLQMLEAAKRAGVTSIVCTPHCRDPYFDYDAMWDAYDLLSAHADGFPLRMGFEVNHKKLMELGLDWADNLHFDGSNEFLLELSSRCTEADFTDYERTIFALQGKGYQVIIAHPERYRAIQRNPDLAQRLVDQGCLLQASSDFITGGRLGKEKKPAKRLFAMGLYSYIASDAHGVDHYDALAKAVRLFGDDLEPVVRVAAPSGPRPADKVPGRAPEGEPVAPVRPVAPATTPSGRGDAPLGAHAAPRDGRVSAPAQRPRNGGAHFKR